MTGAWEGRAAGSGGTPILRGAEGLRQLGLGDLADVVMAKIPAENNKAVSLAKFQIVIHQNVKTPEKIELYIQEHAAHDPELYWMMKIRLADAYWAQGKSKESAAIYEEFLRFYQEWRDKAAKNGRGQ